jgi:hypothetical protein
MNVGVGSIELPDGHKLGYHRRDMSHLRREVDSKSFRIYRAVLRQMTSIAPTFA